MGFQMDSRQSRDGEHRRGDDEDIDEESAFHDVDARRAGWSVAWNHAIYAM
jgi:hypothetical protein